jgi:hypothetical protein
LSFIFLSPGDDSITAIAAAATKRWTHPPACCCPQSHASLLSRSKMPLLPPMPQSLLFGHGNLSSGCCSLLLPLPAAVLSLSLLPATACLYRSHQWLVVASFPAQLSAAHSVIHHSHHDTFVAGHHNVLFSICAILFLIAPLPPSMVVIPPSTAFNPCTLLCPSCSLVWSSLIHPGWLLHRILSCHHLLSAGSSACHLVTASLCPP